MADLFVVGRTRPGFSYLTAVKAVREAQKIMGVPGASAHSASATLRKARDTGTSVIGSSDDLDGLERLKIALSENGVNARVGDASDFDAEEAEPDADEPLGPDPVYETALALMYQTDGNPIQAAVLAHTLERTTEDSLYADVRDALCSVFPAIEDPLKKAGVR